MKGHPILPVVDNLSASACILDGRDLDMQLAQKAGCRKEECHRG